MDKYEFWLQAGGVAVDAVVGLLTYLTLRAAIKANKTANNANEIANKANEIANTANTYTRAEISQSIDAMLQTKNVELFEKRFILLNTIAKFELKPQTLELESDIFDKKTELQLLFRNDKDIKNHFINLERIVKQIISINGDVKYWEDETPDEYWQEIYNLEQQLENNQNDSSLNEEYIKLCEKRSWICPDETGSPKNYNYYDMSQEISKLNKNFIDTKERLVNMMKTFIATSIEDEDVKKEK